MTRGRVSSRVSFAQFQSVWKIRTIRAKQVDIVSALHTRWRSGAKMEAQGAAASNRFQGKKTREPILEETVRRRRNHPWILTRSIRGSFRSFLVGGSEQPEPRIFYNCGGWELLRGSKNVQGFRLIFGGIRERNFELLRSFDLTKGYLK